MNTPRLRGLRSASANPLAGGDTYGLAEPDPWCLLEQCLACFARFATEVRRCANPLLMIFGVIQIVFQHIGAGTGGTWGASFAGGGFGQDFYVGLVAAFAGDYVDLADQG